MRGHIHMVIHPRTYRKFSEHTVKKKLYVSEYTLHVI